MLLRLKASLSRLFLKDLWYGRVGRSSEDMMQRDSKPSYPLANISKILLLNLKMRRDLHGQPDY